MSEEVETEQDPLLERVKTVSFDGDFKYAIFLYHEILKKYPNRFDVRRELHLLRRRTCFQSKTIVWFLRQAFFMVKVKYLHEKRAPIWQILDCIEKFLDGDPTSIFGYRDLAKSAFDAKFYDLTEFAIQSIPEDNRDRSDYLVLANALCDEKKFDEAVKVANLLLEEDPDDEEAKDVVWRASVDKSMNKNVSLMMVDGCGSFVPPPRVDASHIVLSNSKQSGEKEAQNGEKKSRARDDLFK
jgi:tetratricopeptide (TPR) repeat protein